MSTSNSRALLIGAAAASSGGAAAGYEIQRSLRFNSADSAYLNRTPASAGNRKTWTWSGWIKRSKISDSVDTQVFSAGTSGASNADGFGFTTTDTINFYSYNGSSFVYLYHTSAVFRDTSAWYHVVAVLDTTNATSTDRVRLYINGVRVTDFISSTAPSQNADGAHINTTNAHYIGKFIDIARYFNGYLADVHFIDGAALDPTSFGEFDATTGVWNPIEVTGLSYGTNGFYLNFADNSSASALGYDAAGSNDWTVNNIDSVPVTVNYDSTVSATQSPVSGYPVANAFDGSVGSSGTLNWYGQGLNDTITVDLSSKSITASSSVGFYVRLGGPGSSSTVSVTATIGGTGYTQTFTNASYQDELITFSASGAVTTIVATLTTANSSYGWGISGVSIDGTYLINVDASDNDSLRDSPTNGNTANDTGAGGQVPGNYATLNPLAVSSTYITLANGNLQTVSTGGGATYQEVPLTIPVDFDGSGKWYVEFSPTAVANTYYPSIGISPASKYFNKQDQQCGGPDGGTAYMANGQKYNAATLSSYAASFTGGDVIGVAVDEAAGTVTMYKNNVSQGTLASSLTGKQVITVTHSSTAACHLNAGQRAFAYSAPSGYKALCTANLDDPTIADGSTAMDVALYTGNGTSQTISGLGFSPDFVWLKSRSNIVGNNLYDVIRGVNKPLITNSTAAEDSTNIYGAVSAFNSDGFDVQVGSTDAIRANASSYTYVAWTWDAGSSTIADVYGAAATVSSTASLATTLISTASPSTVPNSYQNYDLDLKRSVTSVDIKFTYSASNISYLVSTDGTTWTSLSTGNSQTGGATSTISHGSSFRYLRFHYPSGNFNQGFQEINNTDGSIGSSVIANPTAGFSIVTYTGTGSSGTIGHGLGVKPKVVLIKNRDAVADWGFYYDFVDGTMDRLLLNTTDAKTDQAVSAPTSTVFSTAGGSGDGANGEKYVAYCFAPIEGYSAFGSYTGNGSSDGPFVFTGHRSRWLMIKRTDSTGSWVMLDTARNSYNPAEKSIYADTSDAEYTPGQDWADILSNGFKPLATYVEVNASGGTYVFASFAENPFKIARAR